MDDFTLLGDVAARLVERLSLERAGETEAAPAKSREEETRRVLTGAYSWRWASTAKLVSRNGGVVVSPSANDNHRGRRASG